MSIIRGSQTGTVFELTTPCQMFIESLFRSQQLTGARQELLLDNISAGSQTRLCYTEVGLNKQELITTCSCLFLQPGIYRWFQRVFWDDMKQPVYLRYDRNLPRLMNDFGTGVSLQQYENTGSGTIICTMSGQAGRKIYAKGWVKYDLSTNESLSAQLIVKNLSTGDQTYTSVTQITGEDTDTLETDILPYFFSPGALFEVSLLIQTNAAKRPECKLIHQEQA